MEKVNSFSAVSNPKTPKPRTFDHNIDLYSLKIKSLCILTFLNIVAITTPVANIYITNLYTISSSTLSSFEDSAI